MAALVLFFLVLLGSGVGWAVRDRAAREAEAAPSEQAERQAKVAGQVELILAEVDQLEREQKWPEALAAARRAEAAVAGGEADAATAKRVRERLKDLEFIDRLEQIRMQRATWVEGKFDYAGVDREYARAFRDYGVDVEELAVETSIERLKARPALAIPLAAALDDWVDARRRSCRRGSRRLEAAGGRRARHRSGAAARPAASPPGGSRLTRCRTNCAGWPSRSTFGRNTRRRFVSLAQTLRRVKHPEAALRLLRDAQDVYPGDFWLNFELAAALAESEGPRRGDSVLHRGGGHSSECGRASTTSATS